MGMFLRPAFWIGAGVVLAVEFLPSVGKALRPAAVGAVKAGRNVAGKVKERAARAREEFDDIMAEAKAEEAASAEPASEPAPKPRARRNAPKAK